MIAALYFTTAAISTAVGDGFSFPGFFSTNWDRIGGWSLFIGLCILIVISYMREWVVPGRRYRHLEDAANLQSQTLSDTVKALDKQVAANQITKHFFEETTPTRRERTRDEETPE
jgi:hypothetical protein